MARRLHSRMTRSITAAFAPMPMSGRTPRPGGTSLRRQPEVERRVATSGEKSMMTLDRAQLLAGVGANSPMGSLLRQYWVPAIRAERLDAGGTPVRLRISGENLVAFRAHDGRVGIFDEGCPHRGVSLSLARNEDNALRCIFHGWKIDVTGKLVDIPTEPSERCAAFAESVKFGRYQTHEEGGIVWAWLGRGEAPVFPTFAFAGLPAAHVISFVGLLGCHWLQALEMLTGPLP